MAHDESGNQLKANQINIGVLRIRRSAASALFWMELATDALKSCYNGRPVWDQPLVKAALPRFPKLKVGYFRNNISSASIHPFGFGWPIRHERMHDLLALHAVCLQNKAFFTKELGFWCVCSATTLFVSTLIFDPAGQTLMGITRLLT